MYSKFKLWCLCFLSYIIFRLLTSTYRVQFFQQENLIKAKSMHPNSSFIYALWHEHFFTAVASHPHQGITPMISQSNDGEIITYIGRKLGFTPVRGSTSRGGAEARDELYNQAALGLKAAFTVDGPTGPRHKLKSGVVDLARNTSMPILPLAISADRCWILTRSWDHSMIPKPFAKVSVVYGEPLCIKEDTHGSEFAAAKRKASEALKATNAYARKIVETK